MPVERQRNLFHCPRPPHSRVRQLRLGPTQTGTHQQTGKNPKESCEIYHRKPQICTRKHCPQLFPFRLPPLQERLAKLKATMIFKIQNNLIEISKNKLVPSPTPRHQFNFQVPHSKLDLHKNSFFPSSIRLWNNLPDDIKTQADINRFKSLIGKFSFLD